MKITRRFKPEIFLLFLSYRNLPQQLSSSLPKRSVEGTCSLSVWTHINDTHDSVNRAYPHAAPSQSGLLLYSWLKYGA